MRLLLTITLLVFLGLFSCTKDAPPIENYTEGSSIKTSELYSGNITDISESDTGCYNFTSGSTGVFPDQDTIQYTRPRINYNNNNEFIYIEYNTITYQSKLVKYNLNTNNKTILKNNVSFNSQPDWKNSLILYENNGEIKIIDETGVDIQSIQTNSGIESLIFGENDNIYLIQNNTIKSINLNSGNSVNHFSTHQNWIGNLIQLDINELNSNLLCTNLDTIIAVNVDINATAPLITLQDYFEFGGTPDYCWSRNEQGVLYFSVTSNGIMGGLYKLDLKNESLTRLIEYCTSKTYYNISVSSNDEFIIADRGDYDNYNNDKTLNYSIYKIDLNTLEETKINL